MLYLLSFTAFTVVTHSTFFFHNLPNNDLTDGSVNFIFCHWKEEDEQERLKQVKELQEASMGDNSEALEEFFLGMTLDEVCASLFFSYLLRKLILNQELLMNLQLVTFMIAL